MLPLLCLSVCQLRIVGPNGSNAPFFRLWIERVPETVVRIVLEADASGRVPLRVFLRESFLGVSPDLQLLSFAKIHNQNVIILPVVVRILVTTTGCYRNDLRLSRFEVVCGDMSGGLITAFHVKGEFDGTVRAEIRARAIPAILHVFY